MKRLAFYLHTPSVTAWLRMLLYITTLRKLLTDQCQILLLAGNIQRIAHRLQMLYFLSCFL